MKKETSIKIGNHAYTLGNILDITISWSLNHSILWAIIHGFFSWLYVIYYMLFL